MKQRIKYDSLAYYHCMSRIVGRQMLLGDVEKEHLHRLIRRVEGFTGVRVLTYALMTNHIHLLLEEPERNTCISDELFKTRLRYLYTEQELAELYERWTIWESDGCEQAVQEDKQRYLDRMHDISEFMKQIKQRFSRWYNKKNNRSGTLWDERFKSVLVEQGAPLRVVGAYIEMNAVRAGMVAEPQGYRFCGFGEAMGGGTAAKDGIRTIAACMNADSDVWDTVSSLYLERILMYDEVRNHPEQPCTDHDFLRGKIGKRLKLTDHERLLCRCRYFTDGRIIGCKAFIESFFNENRDYFGPKRKTGAKKIRGGWQDLFAIRELIDW
ncbi:MAG: hypothetical protein EOL87_12365 [Spartobacteria bacterium]|nr:hypothetical protein [Spartobacteria bacterium]